MKMVRFESVLTAELILRYTDALSSFDFDILVSHGNFQYATRVADVNTVLPEMDGFIM